MLNKGFGKLSLHILLIYLAIVTAQIAHGYEHPIHLGEHNCVVYQHGNHAANLPVTLHHTPLVQQAVEVSPFIAVQRCNNYLSLFDARAPPVQISL